MSLTLDTIPTVSYQILIDGQPWLKSGVTSLASRGNVYTSSVGLRFIAPALTRNRDEVLGDYQELTLMWLTAGGTALNTSFVVYDNAPAIRFVQSFPYVSGSGLCAYDDYACGLLDLLWIWRI